MKNCIILTVGPPGCGKTTWAKNFKDRKGEESVEIVCRDDIRFDCFGSYTCFKDENLVTRIQRQYALDALVDNKMVIVADTNMNEKTVALWHNIAKGFGIPVFEKHFKDSLDWDLLQRRNKERDKSVPHRVLQDFYRRYREANYKPYRRNESLPQAVVFDVDGTLAKMVSRGPYDWKRVGEDECHEDVASIARIYGHLQDMGDDINIIILTGRDGSCENETREWLAKNYIPYDELYIRPEGNFEKDSILKYDIFKRELEGRYNVIGIYDDRDQVCNMWREIGVRCYQVAASNF